MNELCPSQNETLMILKRLQKNKSETRNIDAKEQLNLKENGDCATFIRHIAALANTSQNSNLLIGVEDKTWNLKGIPELSPLLNVDETKQQMNQILRSKLDPMVEVDYRVYSIDGISIGIVGVKGSNPPYIISMPDTRFGGGKTKGGESFIYKGVIYIRNGTDSIPVSRQNEILEILNGKQDYVEIVFSLFLIGVITSIGIGLGLSLFQFGDLVVPAILGSIFGMVIGGVLSNRLAESFGRFPVGWMGKAMKNFSGLLWGGFIGGFISFQISEGIFTGKISIQNPLFMGLFLSPILVVIWMVAIVPYLFLLPNLIKFLSHKILKRREF